MPSSYNRNNSYGSDDDEDDCPSYDEEDCDFRGSRGRTPIDLMSYDKMVKMGESQNGDNIIPEF